jgi:4-diphosphocytidyl-2-C-methyl-D-erythritol kinase
MLSLFSPAKINLFFHVLDRRNDGYHEVASVMQALDFGDTIELSTSSEDTFTCSVKGLPLDGNNLIMMAVERFRNETAITTPLRIHLTKRIPWQAGLGGGSSNAATTLWGLNVLFDTNIPEATLRLWSADIGSDVPFFFSSGTAYCSGRGEIITPHEALPRQELWLVKPDEGLSTPAVFKALKINPKTAPELSVAADYIKYGNDLEAPACEIIPRLKEIKSTLLTSGYSHVMMTGSGTAFVCYGTTPPPSIPNTRAYKTSFLSRDGSAWF